MSAFILLVGLCATPDPGVSDCYIIFGTPVHAVSKEACEAQGRAYARMHFKAPPFLPTLGVECVSQGQSS